VPMVRGLPRHWLTATGPRLTSQSGSKFGLSGGWIATGTIPRTSMSGPSLRTWMVRPLGPPRIGMVFGRGTEKNGLKAA
jgi:hypothetical protein